MNSDQMSRGNANSDMMDLEPSLNREEVNFEPSEPSVNQEVKQEDHMTKLSRLE